MPKYMVSIDGGEEIPLEGPTQASVRNYAVRDKVNVRLADMDDAMELGKAGKTFTKVDGPDEGEPAPQSDTE